MTLAAQGKAFPRPRKAYLRRCCRLGSDCLLGCRLLLLATALTAGHHQRQRACSRANRGLPSSRWRLEGEGTSTAATHASRMSSVRRGTLHGRHCCCFRLHDCAQFSWLPARCRCARACGTFLRSQATRHHAHAADTCGSQVLRHGIPCGMRQVLCTWHSMWNASEISGLEKDPDLSKAKQTTWKWYLRSTAEK